MYDSIVMTIVKKYPTWPDGVKDYIRVSLFKKYYFTKIYLTHIKLKTLVRVLQVLV